MDIQILQQADLILNKCGRPVPPAAGLSLLPIAKSFTAQFVFDQNTATPLQTITKEVTGDAPWEWRGMQISSSTATVIAGQVLKPDGTFLINNLQDILQIAGYGSLRFVLTAPLVCPPGSKIQITFQDNDTSVQQPINVEFSGAYRYLLRSNCLRICPTDEAAGRLPRIFGNVNQNNWAPAWQHGVSDPTPEGFEDKDYTYSGLLSPNDDFPAGAPGSSISVTAAVKSAVQQIGLDSAEFHCKRILIQVSADDTVTAGIVLARIRTGSGFSLMDDYIDAAKYIGSVPYPVDLVIAPNDTVYADLQVADQAGTGNIYWTMFLDGFKRTRVS